MSTKEPGRWAEGIPDSSLVFPTESRRFPRISVERRLPLWEYLLATTTATTTAAVLPKINMPMYISMLLYRKSSQRRVRHAHRVPFTGCV